VLERPSLAAVYTEGVALCRVLHSSDRLDVH
jgi:hypothetical protein